MCFLQLIFNKSLKITYESYSKSLLYFIHCIYLQRKCFLCAIYFIFTHCCFHFIKKFRGEIALYQLYVSLHLFLHECHWFQECTFWSIEYWTFKIWPHPFSLHWKFLFATQTKTICLPQCVCFLVCIYLNSHQRVKQQM